MSIQVKLVHHSDLDQLSVLFDGYRIFYRQPSDPVRARTFIAERLRLSDSVIFLARSDGSPPEIAIGFAQLYPSFTSVRTQRIWILNDLFVASDARRKGVGRSLIDAAHRHASETGAAAVSLSTEHTNETAKALYRKMGYTADTRFEHYTFSVAGPASV
jgi:ribosomal protein S18 acetylase RimI-like enzyme